MNLGFITFFAAAFIGVPDVADDIIALTVAPATKEFPRNSEGDIIELKDGSLLLAWSRFGGGTQDADSAVIAGMKSRDGGKTWSEPFIVQENVGRQNVMSASLIRLKSGKIGLFYLVKNSLTDLHLWARYSEDEGTTWGKPLKVTLDEGYNIVNNDRIIQLSNGRLIAPVSFSPDIGKPVPLISFVLYSDDEGLTWSKSQPDLHAPKRGAMEPGVVELADGRLMMVIRTQTGKQYLSFSKDNGKTWTEPVTSDIDSPEAPATVKRIPGRNDLLMVWNNRRVDPGSTHIAQRTPLTSAISRDNGKTWENIKNIEDDPKRTFSYISMTFVKDRVLLTYYDTSDWSSGLSLKFKSIPLVWFYQ